MSIKNICHHYILYFNGQRLPVAREGEIKKIDVFLNLNKPSVFTITAWDSKGFWQSDDNFQIGMPVEITVTDKSDELSPLIKGEITGIALRLQTGEGSIIKITGQCRLHRLCRGKQYRFFSDKNANEVLEEMISEAGLRPADVTELSYIHKFTVQNAMPAYQYLRELAKRYDCFFYVQDRDFYFMRPASNADEDVVLEWGKTLLSFSPSTDSTQIISETEVRSWDGLRKEMIVANAGNDQLDSPGAQSVHENWGGAKKTFIDFFHVDQDKADQLALDNLTQSCRKYSRAKGSCPGNPDIQAGGIIRIEGIGEKYSGKYFVDSVHHVLNPHKGYETHFTVTAHLASSSDMPGENSFIEQVAEQGKAGIQNPVEAKNMSLLDKAARLQDMASKVKNAKEYMRNRGQLLDDAQFLKDAFNLPDLHIAKLEQFIDKLEEPRRRAQETIERERARVKKVIEEGQKRVDEVTQQIEEAKTKIEEAKSKIEDAKARIEEKIHNTREKAEAKVEKYKNKYKETKEKVEQIKVKQKEKIEQAKARVEEIKAEAKG